jgi:metallo-beta-lactamase class B
MRFFLVPILLFNLQFIRAQQNAGRLDISHLTGDFYIYTTYKDYKGDVFPANGMYMVTEKGIVLFDTPWDTTQAQPLLDTIEKRHHKPVVFCISTHSHADRTGAVNFFKRKGIQTWSHERTFRLFKEADEFTSRFYFKSDTTFSFTNHTFKAQFAGEGHAPDNIVLWFDDEKILYGGCLIKSTEAEDLGNIAHANMALYPKTIQKLLDTYPDPKFVIPGHQDWKNKASLTHTGDLLNGFHDVLRVVKDFVRAAKYDDAINFLESNIDSVYNDTTGLFDALVNLYFFKSEWQKIIDVYAKHRAKENEDMTVLDMAEYNVKQPKEEIALKSASCRIPFDPSMSGTPIIEVVVNGQKMNCWFDTGAGLTVLSSTMAKKCKLKISGADNSSASAATGKTVSTQLGIIDSLRINELTVKNHPCLVLNKKDLEFRILGIRVLKIDAIIGWNFIQEFDVKLSNKTKSIELTRNVREYTGISNFIWMGQPMIQGTTMKGEKTFFFIDTGAQTAGVYDSFVKKADVSNAKIKTIRLGSAGGSTRIKSYIFPEVKIDVAGNTVTMNNVASMPNGYTVPFICDGVFGINEFKNKEIHFNIKQGFFFIKE